MTKTQYRGMVSELKQEFEKVFRSGHLNGIVHILLKYHPTGRGATTDAQILITSEFIRSGWNRGELVPLCSIASSRDLVGNYAGVGFGVSPKYTIRLPGIRSGKKGKRKSRRRPKS